MSQKNSLRDVIEDMVKALKPVFKRTTRYARTEAWEKLTSKKGQDQMKKILNDPDRPINTFAQLAFKEWIITEDRYEQVKMVHDFVKTVDELYPDIDITNFNKKELHDFMNKEDLCPRDMSCDRFVGQLLSYFSGSTGFRDVNFPPPL